MGGPLIEKATLDDSRVLQGLRAAKGDERRGLEVALEDERVARCRAEDRAQALAEEMLKEERSARRRAEEHAQVLAQGTAARAHGIPQVIGIFAQIWSPQHGSMTVDSSSVWQASYVTSVQSPPSRSQPGISSCGSHWPLL